MDLPRKAVNFTAGWEGWVNNGCPYRDPVGVWTRGYGETEGIGPDSRCVTKAEAWQDLKRRLEQDYGPAIPRRSLMSTKEKAALADFAYNMGPGAVSDPFVSTLARRLKSDEGKTFEGRKRIYREELPRWVKAGNPPRTLEGLVKRREAEIRLAIHGDYSGRP
jgi:lysozyme